MVGVASYSAHPNSDVTSLVTVTDLGINKQSKPDQSFLHLFLHYFYNERSIIPSTKGQSCMCALKPIHLTLLKPLLLD